MRVFRFTEFHGRKKCVWQCPHTWYPWDCGNSNSCQPLIHKWCRLDKLVGSAWFEFWRNLMAHNRVLMLNLRWELLIETTLGVYFSTWCCSRMQTYFNKKHNWIGHLLCLKDCPLKLWPWLLHRNDERSETSARSRYLSWIPVWRNLAKTSYTKMPGIRFCDAPITGVRHLFHTCLNPCQPFPADVHRHFLSQSCDICDRYKNQVQRWMLLMDGIWKQWSAFPTMCLLISCSGQWCIMQ